MAQQLTVRVANRPGQLARVCEALAKAKINITGLDASGRERTIRLVVGNAARGRKALAQAGLRASVARVTVLTLTNRPGALARAARKIARRRKNIQYAYATAARGTRRAAVVLGF